MAPKAFRFNRLARFSDLLLRSMQRGREAAKIGTGHSLAACHREGRQAPVALPWLAWLPKANPANG